MSQSVVEAIVGALKRHGVTEIFGQSLPSAFFLAAETAGIRQVVYRTENAGGAMADGYARVANRIGLVGAQNGPAATLLVPPLTEAMLVSIPLIAIVQDVPTQTRDKNAFQELDHHALFSSCSKWTRHITDPTRVDEYVDRAITIATSGKPGPVVLLLPKDSMLMDEVPAPRPRTSVLGHFPLDRPRPSSDSVARAAELIASAKAPLVIAGGGVNRAQAAASLARLQELAHLPVATTNMGKGSVDEYHPLSVGVIGNVMGRRSSTHFQKPLLEEADVVLLVGTRTNENGTDSWKLIPKDAAVLHLDSDGAEIGRNYEGLRMVGDARAGLDDLVDALGASDLSARVAARASVESRIRDGHDAHEAELAELVDMNKTPIRPERVMRELDELMDEDTIFAADASYSTIWLSNYVKSRRAGQQFVMPRGMAGLGWGVPMAMGAKVAKPDATVVCIVGDGGFGHVWQEIETAVRMDLPLTIVLLNNSILGFQKHSELYQFAKYTSAITFNPVDHAAIARACGAQAVRVERPEDLAGALRTAVESNAVYLVEVMTDSDAFPPITAWEGRAEVLPALASSDVSTAS